MLGPLDSGDPRERTWTEFRVAFAGATAMAALLVEIDELQPNYFNDFRQRVADAVSQGEVWLRDGYDGDEEWDGYVPLQGPSGRSVLFLPLEDAQVLEEQLFPAGGSQMEDRWISQGFVVVALHSTLDSYAQSVGVRKGRLPEAVTDYLAVPPSVVVPVQLYRDLVDCDESRHLFVHHRGVVTARFANSVPYNELNVGERRPITYRDIQRFLRACWAAAVALREKASTRPSSGDGA
jgi:hypothetical protein